MNCFLIASVDGVITDVITVRWGTNGKHQPITNLKDAVHGIFHIPVLSCNRFEIKETNRFEYAIKIFEGYTYIIVQADDVSFALKRAERILDEQ